MKDFFSKINFPLIAAVMLLGLGLYYFIFEQEKKDVWVTLLLGALLNMYFAVKQKERQERE